MFHITLCKSPDPTVIISLCLPLPPHLSTSDLLFHPFILLRLLCIFHPELLVLSDFSSSAETMFET